MNTQQLESFLQVAENLNFARAAEAMNITQSAVSRQIHSLEEELGTKLFFRSTRTVSLTPAGISFLEDAKDIFAKFQMATLKIEKHSHANIQVLSLGFVNEICLNLITQILSQYQKQQPNIHPFLRYLPSRSILNLFFNGEMEILFGFQDDIPAREGIRYREITKIPICCVVPVSHPLAQHSSIKEEEILSERFIICRSYEIPAKVTYIQHHFGQQLSPNNINFCENMIVVLSLIKAGYGMSILPQNIGCDTQLAYIPIADIDALSYGIFYKENAKNDALKSFINVIDEWEKPSF